VRSGAVCSGTAVEAGRSRVRFPMGSLGYCIDLMLGSTQLLTEINNRGISGKGLKAAGA
jgi:hypothetical protein